MEGLSIIIPYNNEGLEFITTTINQIKDTIDYSPYEIIIVDDLSDEPLNLEDESVSLVIRHESNKGVGQAFDTGVSYAKYSYLWLMGADIRFEANHWASLIVEEIKKYPKAITCTTCVDYTEGVSFENTISTKKMYGADILTYHAKNRRILQAQWIRSKKEDNSYSIPCILGSAYGISKEWYTYIDGFWGHKQWGTLEPYISLKSKKFGGDCRIDPNIETGHIFKRYGSNIHHTKQSSIMYNQLLVANLLFEDEQRDKLISRLGDNVYKQEAMKLIGMNYIEIINKRREYLDKINKVKK